MPLHLKTKNHKVDNIILLIISYLNFLRNKEIALHKKKVMIPSNECKILFIQSKEVSLVKDKKTETLEPEGLFFILKASKKQMFQT